MFNIEDPRAAHAAETRQRNAATAAPRPAITALKILSCGLYNGQTLEAGDLALIWPRDPAPGFIRQESVASVIEDGLAVMATDAEIDAFLNAQSTTK